MKHTHGTRKWIFSVFIVLALLAVLLPTSVFAEEDGVEIVESGTCGENATYVLDINGTLTISGTGAISEAAYRWVVNRIVIGEGITSIEDAAFSSCTWLTSVQLPNTLISIGEGAFADCWSLTSIDIPLNVTSIGDYAFYDCIGLTRINLPDSLTSIGTGAFSGCDSLTSIDLPDSLTSIMYGTFSNCGSLMSINLPDSLTSIGEYAFSGCTSLTSITIPDSVASIDWLAFADCSSLTSINLPNSLTSIAYYTFNGCTSLTSITIPDSVTSIGDFTFSGCTSLTGITIPDSVTSIGEYAFYYCTSLMGIDLPDSLMSIGEWAFGDCTALTSIDFPDSLASIGELAFVGCSNLSEIFFNGDAPGGAGCFSGGVTATAYYPAYNETWTDDVMFSYEGDITWVAQTHTWDIGTAGPEKCMVTYTCTECGRTKTEMNHTWGEWVTTIEPTVDSEGEAERECTVCHEVETMVLEPRGGNYFFTTIEELKTYCAEAEQNPEKNYMLYSVIESLTITEDITIPENVDFYAFQYENSEVIIPEGVAVTNLGGVSVNKLTVNGTLDNYSITRAQTTLTVNGTLNNYWDTIVVSELTVNGTINNHSIIYLDWDAELNVAGTLNHDGGFLDWQLDIDDSPEMLYEALERSAADTSEDIWYDIYYSAGSELTLDKDLTVPYNTYVWLIADDMKVTLASNSTLTVNGCVSLEGPNMTIEGTLINNNKLYICNYNDRNSTLTFADGASYVGDGSLWIYAETEEAARNSIIGWEIDEFWGESWDYYATLAQKGETHVHAWGEPAVTTPATCTTDGVNTYTCACGETKTESIPTTGHTEVIDAAVDATCTTDGMTEGKHCSVCNEVLVKQEVVPATGHTEVIDAAVDATCTTDGMTEGKHCSVCNEVLVKQEVVPATGHTEVIDAAVDATCTTDGLTEGKHCEVCGEILVAQEVISATGHAWGDWETTKEPTADANGEMMRKCGSCDAAETKVLFAILDGEQSVWNPDEPAPIVVRANAAIADFVSVMLNGELVDPSNYDVTEGSTIITFHEDFLATLKAGEYTVTMNFTSGTATASLKVSASEEFKLGDVNGDGKLNAKDATAILKYIVGKLDNAPANFKAIADVNGDTKVNAKDATKILKTIVGKDTIEGWK